MRQLGEWWLVGALMLAACTDSTAPPVAVKLAFTVQPSNATAGVAIGPAVVMAIEDASGNTVTGAANVVTVSIGTNPTGGTLAGTVSVSSVNGVATFSNLHLDKAGTGYTLTATATGLAGATSTRFDITAGAATKLVFTVQPSNTMGGGAITPPVQVAAQDSFGNVVTEFNDIVTIALGGNPATSTLSGTTAVNAVSGVATFGDLTIMQVNTGYTLTASAGGLTGVSSVPFAIAKPTGSLHVTTATTGSPPDPDGYAACVDPASDGAGGTACGYGGSSAVGVNGTVTMTVDTGAHTVLLMGVAANCAVAGDNPRAVNATRGEIAAVPFAVACAAVTLHVTTTTTGVSFDPDGYRLCVDPVPDPWDPGYTCTTDEAVGVNSGLTVSVALGTHVVELYGVAPNCAVSGDNPRTVTANAPTEVPFAVTCALPERIAFVFGGTIRVIADRSTTQVITPGLAPAWSTDGARLAYECSQDICAINADGTGFARLTVNAAGNHHPTWSPDGLKIAFAATPGGVPDLYVMAANGSAVVRLTQGIGFQGNPAWSPDGTKIAFDCVVDAGNDDICVVNADGTGLARLTSDPARDYGAAWKPDGSTLAFVTTRYGADEIMLVSPAGGSVTRIGAGLPGREPTWSPDGTRLAFVLMHDCGVCTQYALIMVAHTDGSAVTYLTGGHQPAWKPHP